MDIWFERMGVEHGKEVMEIFNYYMEKSFAKYPDTVLPYPFYGRLLEITRDYPSYVIRIKDSGAVIGFCFLHAYNPFLVFRHTAELTCIINRDEVRKGVGTQALAVLEQDAKKMGINILLASIDSKNKAGISFHEKNGFKECGRFYGIGEKQGQPLDQVWMQKCL